MGFEQSGMELILKDSFSAVGRRYAQAVGQINRVDEQSAKVAALAARARQSYAKTVSETTKTVKSAADTQRKALRTILDESKTIQTAIDPSKWVKSADAAKKTLGDLIPAGVRDRLDGFSKGIGNIVGKMGSLPGPVQAATGSLGNFSTMLGGTVGKMNLAITAATALTVVFIGLGMRGAAMRGVVEAFDVSADRAGVLANVLLDDLHAASRGTIADMQLMRTANIALAGAGDQLAQALGREGGLAGLLEIARAQARATGQDVDFLFQSLVSGVKRSSPLLIDNTGLVLKVGEANAAYAQSIGKSVELLSAQEKQIALLNATLAAGQVAVDAYGNRSLTAAERLARINTTITNTLDRLSLAIQPAFELLLAIGETLLNVLVYPIRDILLPIFAELVSTIFGPLTMAWEGLTSGLQDLLAPALQTIHRWVVLVVSVLQGFGYALRWVVRTAGKILGPFKDIIKKAIVEPIAKFLDPAAFAQRAGNIFGAFAGGILWAANTMIFPAVIQIAQFIASLLMGSSPPPAGPLSTIDRGAANVMEAWLAGFTGVPLTPVADMAAAVNAELGAIGTLTNTQARAMLALLDAQLQPFIDHLTIAKARMEELVTPLKEAADILQKRVTKNVKAFFAGDLSAEELRTLDAQNQAVNDRLSMFQDMSDEAQLQLAMMKAQQAVQRALLGIQIARTQEAEATTSATAGGSSAARSRAGGGGGAADETAAAGGGAGMPDIDADPVGDFLGVTDEEVNQLWGDIATGFAGGLTENPLFSEQWALAEDNVNTLGDALKDISDSNAFNTLTSAFNNVFGDGEDSIRTKVGNFVSDVETWFTDELPGYFNGFSLSGIADKFTETFGVPDGTAWSSVNRTYNAIRNLFANNFPNIFGNFSLSEVADKFTETFGIPNGTAWSNVKRTYNAIRNVFDISFPNIFSDFSLSGITDTFTEVFGIPNGTVWSSVKQTYNAIRNVFDVNFPNVFNNFSLKSITTKFLGFFGLDADSVRSKISDFVTDVQGWFTVDIPGWFKEFDLSGLTDAFAIFQPGGAVYDALNSFVSWVDDLLKPEGTFGKLANSLGNNFIASIPGAGAIGDIAGLLLGGGGGGDEEKINRLNELLATLPILDDTNWINVFGEGGTVRETLSSFMQWANNTWSGAFGEEGTLTLMLNNWFTQFETIFGTDIPAIIDEFSLQPIVDTFNNVFGQASLESGENVGVSAMLVAFSDLFNQVIGPEGKLDQAMANIGPAATRLIARPFEAVFNAVLVGVTEAMNEAITVLNAMITAYNRLGIGASIGTLNRINQPPSISIADLIGAATGGAFSAGLLRVHKGEVVATASSPMAVFPARWVTAMETIARNTAQQTYRPLPTTQPVIVPVSGSQSGLNITQHFNGQADNNSVRRGWYELQALGAMRS